VTLGQKLKILREGKDLTQIELAQELNNITPFSQARVSSYERDNTIPDFIEMCKLCQYFGINVSSLWEEIKDDPEHKIMKKPQVKPTKTRRAEGG